VIMPFSAELHYFYLFIKRHIEETHNIECLRADERIQSGFMTEKIIALIRSADILIADITGRNANVFYELGIAHAQDKKVIIITRDPVENAPTDIKSTASVDSRRMRGETSWSNG
jgi:nucleoside 2-deoxyribosyltransferase